MIDTSYLMHLFKRPVWPDKKSPNVYKSCPKMISVEKLMILTPLQKLPRNVGNLGKIIVCHQLWIAAQSAKNCPIWSHWWWERELEREFNGCKIRIPVWSIPKTGALMTFSLSFFKNGPTPASFSFFSVFSSKHQYNFYNKYMWKMSIQFTVPGFEPTTFGM